MDSFTHEQLELQQELDALNEVMMRNLLETPMTEEDWTTLTERTTDLTMDDTPPTRPSMTEWRTPVLIDMERPTFSDRRRQQLQEWRESLRQQKYEAADRIAREGRTMVRRQIHGGPLVEVPLGESKSGYLEPV
ncbi:hypothetical protein TKK_0001641 [Trichogramma kaykai]